MMIRFFGEGDRVTLLAATGDVWWTARMEAGRAEVLSLLKRLEGQKLPETRKDWMSDYEAMRIHVFRDNMILDRVQRRFETYGLMTMTRQSQHVRNMMAVEDPVVTSRAAEVYYTAKARNQVTLAAVERALESLAPVRGRKSMVLVSEGFVYDAHLPEFKRIIDVPRRVNAAIYFINSRGLDGLPDALSASVGINSLAVEVQQIDTGTYLTGQQKQAEGDALYAQAIFDSTKWTPAAVKYAVSYDSYRLATSSYQEINNETVIRDALRSLKAALGG